MSDATQALKSPAAGQAKPLDYDAFLSYAHRDKEVTTAIKHTGHR